MSKETKFKFENAGDFLDGFAKVQLEDGSLAYVDKDGNTLKQNQIEALEKIDERPESFLELPTEEFKDQSFIKLATERVKNSLTKVVSKKDEDYEKYATELMTAVEDKVEKENKKIAEQNKQISLPLHEKALGYYRTYLITGGMPESIKSMVDTNGDYIRYDNTILKDILNSYFNDMDKYVTSLVEALKIRRIYNSLPSQLSNLSNKFQYSKIEKGARARDYETSLDWLEASNMVVRSKCVKNSEIPLEGFILEDTFKLYLSDVGILNSILKINIDDILTDNISLYKGIIAENYVANQLICNGFDLYYWKNNNKAEIDFLLYTSDGIIPVEVKAGNNTKAKSLNIYNEIYNTKYAIRISTKEFGYNPKTKIKSIPLYAVFLLKY